MDWEKVRTYIIDIVDSEDMAGVSVLTPTVE